MSEDGRMPQPSAGPSEERLYDDLSRLNNELANLQRSLARRNAELERLDREKNQLLGIAAHDLRGPIGLNLTISECLRELLPPSIEPRHHQILDQLERNNRFMSDLIDDMLALVSIESGELRMDLQTGSPSDLVRESVALHRPIAERKRIEIDLEVEERLPEVEIDRGKFGQVVHNLLSNAIKFSDAGGRVTIRLRPSEESGVVLEVADEGLGIPADELEAIFRPFARATPQPTAGEKSTGLGLAIVDRIVSGHRGRISVRSEVGRGSTFRVELPAAR